MLPSRLFERPVFTDNAIGFRLPVVTPTQPTHNPITGQPIAGTSAPSKPVAPTAPGLHPVSGTLLAGAHPVFTTTVPTRSAIASVPPINGSRISESIPSIFPRQLASSLTPGSWLLIAGIIAVIGAIFWRYAK